MNYEATKGRLFENWLETLDKYMMIVIQSWHGQEGRITNIGVFTLRTRLDTTKAEGAQAMSSMPQPLLEQAEG